MDKETTETDRMPQPEEIQRVYDYLVEADQDPYKTNDFPIDARWIARSLGLPTETVAASGDLLAEQGKVERFEPVFGLPAAYRIRVPAREGTVKVRSKSRGSRIRRKGRRYA